MTTLADKIQKTTLFTDDEKITVISELENLTEDEHDQLEDSIDDYNESFKSIVSKYKEEITPHLATLKNSDKIDATEVDEINEEIDKLLE